MIFNNPPKTKRGKELLTLVTGIGSIVGCILLAFTLLPARNDGLNPNGEYISLRGTILLQIEPSLSENTITEDVITLSSKRTAVRVFTKSDIGTRSFGEEVNINDPLWKDIQTLRETWCTQPPATHRPKTATLFYRVVIACHSRAPVLYFLPEELDTSLQTVVELTQRAPIQTIEDWR